MRKSKCLCGKEFLMTSLTAHLKTKVHQNYMKQLNLPNQVGGETNVDYNERMKQMKSNPVGSEDVTHEIFESSDDEEFKERMKHMNSKFEWCDEDTKKLRPYEYAYLKKNKMI